VSETLAHFVLVTPVWNDSDRLRVFGSELAKTLNGLGLNVTWVIADDGSDAGEKDELKKISDQFRRIYPDLVLHNYNDRSRKGWAIHQSWREYPDADFFAFVDADGAITPDTIVALMRQALDGKTRKESIVGVRVLSGSLQVHRTLLRKISFLLFRWLVRMVVGIKLLDTQCGAKVISGKAYRAIQTSITERGYVFDVELLAFLVSEDWPIREIPISWREVAGSKLCLWKDIWSMLAGLLRIRRRLRLNDNR